MLNIQWVKKKREMEKKNPKVKMKAPKIRVFIINSSKRKVYDTKFLC